MIDTLTTASDGYLACATKKLLVIAVAGYLNFCQPTPPSPPHPVEPNAQGGYRTEELLICDEDEIKCQNEEILLIIKAFVICQS